MPCWRYLLIRLRHVGLTAFAAAALFLPIRSAMAQRSLKNSDRLAQEHFDLGKGLFRVGRYHEAAGEFETAYQLSERAPLLYNIYIAARNAGDGKKAADALRGYLTRAPNVADRHALELQLLALEEAIKDDAVAARSIRKTGKSKPDDPSLPHTPPLLGYAITGLGAAMLIGGTVTAFMAEGYRSQKNEHCPENVCLPGYERDIDRLQTASTLRNVLLIGGAGVLALGIGLWILLDDDGQEASAPVTATAACSSVGCMTQAKVRF
ncbi:MAG: hypothetical protein H6715_05780 [Myxococcales bacterium]|nr:hypothetical protein [Myxococcales bacterium]MCB9707895.1 hypothetical protein [Myxococcales bacterium]